MFSGAYPVIGQSIRKAGFQSDVRKNWERQAVEGSKVFLKEMEALSSKRTVDSWTVALGRNPAQILFVHILHLFGSEYYDAKWFEK